MRYGRSAHGVMPRVLTRPYLRPGVALLVIGISGWSHAVTPANTEITNHASANYQVGQTSMRQSASATFTTGSISFAPAATSATLDLLHFSGASGSEQVAISASECADSTGNFTANNHFTDLSGSTQNLPGDYGISALEYGFKVGEPLLVRVEDQDKNLNPVRIDQITVTLSNNEGSDYETLRLSESDINSGIFYGVINTVSADDRVVSYNCALSVSTNSGITASYIDSTDATDTVKDTGTFDPYSRVFDASTGELLNGIQVTLIDNSTGLPATVYDDDGITPYTATLTTGPTASISAADTMATNVSFPDGSFRFPYLPNGEYRLEFKTPTNYQIPSATSNAAIAALDGGFLINAISRGGAFTVSSHLFVTDVPADRLDTGVLLKKSANVTSAAIGDFIKYSVTLTLADVALSDGQLSDQLPVGLTYQPGSAYFAGEKLADPDISRNGRTLRFSIPDVAANSSASLSYVTQVAANAKGSLVNTVNLIDDVLSTNEATARVKVNDDFYRDYARLFGRVYIGDCDNTTEQIGVADVRLFMEDGTYVVTDENGEWHIEHVRPGSHVVQLDTITLPGNLELQACDNLGFHAGRDFSQFVDLQPGSLWRVDYTLKPKIPPSGEVSQKLLQTLVPMSASERTTLAEYHSPVSELLSYAFTLNGEGLAIQNVRSMISLPAGVAYVPGSSQVDSYPSADPKNYTGTLVFDLGDKPEQWQQLITFNGVVTDQAVAGDLTTKAVTLFEVGEQKNLKITPVTTLAKLRIPPPQGVLEQPEQPKFEVFFAELSDNDQMTLDGVVNRLLDLKNIQLEVVGHTDRTRIAPRSRHIFPDNQALSEARADAVADYIKDKLKLTDDQIKAEGRGQVDPIATNTTTEGRAKNRRVEVNLLAAEANVQLESVGAQIESEKIQASLDSLRIKRHRKTVDLDQNEFSEQEKMPSFDENWFASQPETAGWVWPQLDRSASISAVNIAIRHTRDQLIKLKLNGEPVSMLNLEGVFRSRARNLMVTTWKGISINTGANRFSVDVLNKNGERLETIDARVQLSEQSANARLEPELSTLVADGITTPVIAVRLTDRDGYPLHTNLQISTAVESPYTLYSEQSETESSPLNESSQNFYQVGQDGVVRITLAPTNRSGEAVLVFNHADGQSEEIRAWLKPEPREWILVGLGDMTVGFNSTSGDAAGLNATGVDNNIYHDGRVAFYSQGRVSGEWLLTAAYDSGKPQAEAFSQLINADEYYTLYGDASNQQLDASSGRKLYVRLERNRFYTMFGDIDTDLDQTELGQYSRRMTGLQTAYQGENVEATAFVSQTDNGFIRDEIQGDGTSGLYRLSRKNLVKSSESLTLEVHDRYRSELVISTEPLLRDYDYVIDYEDGTIYFKQAIRATDDAFNPRYIVAEYEVDDQQLGYVAGGRAGVKFFDRQLKAGVSAVNVNQPDHEGQLTAVDTTLKLGNTEITGEVGQSSKKTIAGEFSGNAYLLDVTHRSENLQTRAYIRRQGERYGVDDNEDSENDSRKEGIEGTWFIGDRDQLSLTAFHHHELSTGLDTYQGQGDWTRAIDDSNRLTFGVINAQAESETDTVFADQLSAGISSTFFEERLTTNATVLANYTRRSEAQDQLIFSADYKLTNKTSVFSTMETGFAREASQRIGLGVRTSPWRGAIAEQSVEQVRQDDAYQLMALSGLSQEFIIDERWTASLGFDQARNIEANQPAESADQTEDYYALRTGVSYNTQPWQWNNRLEYRDGRETDKWVVSSALYHPISDTLSTGASLDFFRSMAGSIYSQQLDAMFDLALRPQQARYAALWQTRWLQTADGGNHTPDRTRKLINNIHANWMFTSRDQLAGQYGLKRVLSQYDGDDYAASIDYMAGEWRHHLTDRWDVGAHGRRLHSYEAGQSEHGTGLSLGWIPKTNVWLGVGYNFSGFIDSDFSAANYTAQGIFLKIRFKADQQSLAAMRSSFD